ncbi:MAG: ABC transporter permease [Oscillospiraceae bacterium]|nr:ABC transporter permease [Oscillospiraceae bacterium]
MNNIGGFIWQCALVFAAALRLATPLTFAAMGGVISEKSGVVNIGLEGMMTIGCFFGVLGSHFYGPIFGIFLGALAGAVIGLVHAFLCINLRSNQIISGVAINLFTTALAVFLVGKIFNTGNQTDPVPGIQNLPNSLSKIPIIGSFLTQINYFVILAIVIVLLLIFLLYRTKLGLRIRAVGEHPKAADTLGINVYKIRYLCVILSGALAGLGGVALTLGSTPLYREGMVAGRGYIALGAVIFGNWKPKNAALGCLLFAFAEALEIQLQSIVRVPTEIYYMIPYVIVLIVLIGFIGKTTPPLADGEPYVK